MILYRPQRGSFKEAMNLVREFPDIETMKKHIVQENTDEKLGPALSVEDVVIGDETMFDSRNGWNTQYVCTKRYYGEIFKIPQCIGMCDTSKKAGT